MKNIALVIAGTIALAACGPQVSTCRDANGNPQPQAYCQSGYSSYNSYGPAYGAPHYVPVPVIGGYHRPSTTVIIHRNTVVAPARPVYTSPQYTPSVVAKPTFNLSKPSTSSYSRPSYSSSYSRPSYSSSFRSSSSSFSRRR